MTFADTGWFVALVNTDDSLHERAHRWLRSLRDRVITTEYVLLETFNGLSAPLPRVRCHALIPPLIAQLGIVVVKGAEDDLFDLGLQLHGDRRDKLWSLTDCISFVLMKQQGLTAALAHDHHFEQAGFEAPLRREPG